MKTKEQTPERQVQELLASLKVVDGKVQALDEALREADQFQLVPPGLADSDESLEHLVQLRRALPADMRLVSEQAQKRLEAMRQGLDARIEALRSAGYYSTTEPSFRWSDLHELAGGGIRNSVRLADREWASCLRRTVEASGVGRRLLGVLVDSFGVTELPAVGVVLPYRWGLSTEYRDHIGLPPDPVTVPRLYCEGKGAWTDGGDIARLTAEAKRQQDAEAERERQRRDAEEEAAWAAEEAKFAEQLELLAGDESKKKRLLEALGIHG